MAQQYRAAIVYNEERIKKLSACVHSTFHMNFKIVYTVFCLILVFAGCFIGMGTTVGLLCICLGVFLIPSANVLEKSQRDKAIERLHGKQIRVEYRFDEKNFSCFSGNEWQEYSYQSIIRLVEEKEFLYLFPNKAQAYMLDKSTLKKGEVERFKAFITNKVGLEWTKPVSLLTLSLKQLRFNRKNTRNT